jgi:hypothetical protein
VQETQKRLATFQVDALHNAYRHGLEAAAAAVGTLAERPFDTEPEFGAILQAEAVIHGMIRDFAKQQLDKR